MYVWSCRFRKCKSCLICLFACYLCYMSWDSSFWDARRMFCFRVVACEAVLGDVVCSVFQVSVFVRGILMNMAAKRVWYYILRYGFSDFCPICVPPHGGWDHSSCRYTKRRFCGSPWCKHSNLNHASFSCRWVHGMGTGYYVGVMLVEVKPSSQT